MGSRFAIAPSSQAVVNAHIVRWHRHCGLLPVALRWLQAEDRRSGATVAVGALGTPLSRILDDGVTLEVRRTATDGTEHACSAMLGALARQADGMRALRLVTYTRDGESGASLRGAGWWLDEGFHVEWGEDGRRYAGKAARSWAGAGGPGRAAADGGARWRWWRLLPLAYSWDGALALGRHIALSGQMSGQPSTRDEYWKWWSLAREAIDYPAAVPAWPCAWRRQLEEAA